MKNRPNKPGTWFAIFRRSGDIKEYTVKRACQVFKRGDVLRVEVPGEPHSFSINHRIFAKWIGPVHPPKKIPSYYADYVIGVDVHHQNKPIVFLEDVKEYLLEE